jgi:hypothetical protein
MKLLICLLTACITFASYADAPINYHVKTQLELTDGSVLIGFVETSGYGGCEYSAKDKKFKVFTNGGTESQLLTNDYFFKEFIQGKSEEFPDNKIPETITIYKKIYKLNYFPLKKEADSSGEASDDYLLAHYAVLANDIIAIKRSDIKKATVLNCENIDEAGLLTLSKEKIELLQKPDNAILSKEPLNLISYNPNFNTPQQLAKLIKQSSLIQAHYQSVYDNGEYVGEDWIGTLSEEEIKQFQKELPYGILFLYYWSSGC